MMLGVSVECAVESISSCQAALGWGWGLTQWAAQRPHLKSFTFFTSFDPFLRPLKPITRKI